MCTFYDWGIHDSLKHSIRHILLEMENSNFKYHTAEKQTEQSKTNILRQKDETITWEATEDS